MIYLVVDNITDYFEACSPADRKARLAKLASGSKSKGMVKPSDMSNRDKRVAKIVRKFHPDIKKEAVDPSARATRVAKVWAKGRKYDRQANRLYNKSIGYGYDYAAKLPTGDPPVTRKATHKGNSRAAYDLHKYAKAKSDKAMYVARKFANKVKGAVSAKVAKPNVNGIKRIASYLFKTRANRN